MKRGRRGGERHSSGKLASSLSAVSLRFFMEKISFFAPQKEREIFRIFP